MTSLRMATDTHVPEVPKTLYASFLKRAIDLFGSLAAVVLLLPIMAVVAVAVRLVLGAPVLFYDDRLGRNARPIRIAKFRTMFDQRDATGKLLPDKDRLGGFGRFLRRTSLDELPQLFSVIVGDMSLVGPRPLPLRYGPRYTPRQASRMLVSPGLTGWAQVHGRNAISWRDRLELDARYVEYLSRPLAFPLDLWIAVVTACQLAVQSLTGCGVAAPGQATMEEFLPTEK